MVRDPGLLSVLLSRTLIVPDLLVAAGFAGKCSETLGKLPRRPA